MAQRGETCLCHFCIAKNARNLLDFSAILACNSILNMVQFYIGDLRQRCERTAVYETIDRCTMLCLGGHNLV